MTPKNEILKALRGDKLDVLPAAPCYLSLFLADFERAYYIGQYYRYLKGRSRCPINHAQETHFRAQAVYQSYGILKTPPDWIKIGPGASMGRTHRDRCARRRLVL